MGFPVPPLPDVLLVALQPLTKSSWAGRLPNIAVGDAFWASGMEAPGLVAAGQAEIAPPDTVAPPAEPRYTAHGSPGFGAGTSNSSH